MPRPQRCRRVCSEPQFLCFSPGGVEQPEENVLTVDEYEVIRLVDYEKKVMSNVPQRWKFPEQRLQKYTKKPDIKLPNVWFKANNSV